MKLRNSIDWLLKQTTDNRMAICSIVVSGILRVVCGLGFVYATKEMIDEVTSGANGGFMRYAIYLIVLMPAGILLNAVSVRIRSLTEVKVANRLREHLLAHLLDWGEYEDKKRHTGDVQSRLITDVRTVSLFLSGSLPQMFVSSVQLIVSFWFLCSLDARLAYISAVSLVICMIFGRMYAKQMHRLTHAVRSKESDIVSLLQERIQHRTMIKTLGQEPEQLNKLRVQQSDLLVKEEERTRFSICSKTLLTLGFSCGYLFTLLLGAMQLQEGTITFGIMTAFIQLTGQVQRPISELLRVLPSITTTLASTERLRELEEREKEGDFPPVQLEGRTGIRVSDVSFGYGQEMVLNGVSYDFCPGSVTAVLGESGTGKTTLIRLMLALITPERGRLTLYNEKEEIEIGRQTRINFVYVPQGNTLMSGTIRENLLLGNPTASDDQMQRALYVAAAEFVNDLPEGLESRCGEKGNGLSEGQAQRIAIARSLLRPGSILLLDEITSALDEETEELLINRLEENAGDKTIVLVTHRKYISKGKDKFVLTGS